MQEIIKTRTDTYYYVHHNNHKSSFLEIIELLLNSLHIIDLLDLLFDGTIEAYTCSMRPWYRSVRACP